MAKWLSASSPRAGARITGILYLLYFLTAVADEVLIGHGRLALYEAADLIAHAFYVAVTLRFYFLFRPVNRPLSLMAAIVSLAGCANDILDLLNLAPYRINSLVFFGPYCLLIGALIVRSTFLPRILGVLMALAGIGWLIFLLPPPIRLTIYLKILGVVAEASLMLWLIVKGVDEPRCTEQATL
jgi:hypothetical protein